MCWLRERMMESGRDLTDPLVASNGSIRGPYLESAMQQVRADNPNLKVSDMELANAISGRNANGSKLLRSLPSRRDGRRSNPEILTVLRSLPQPAAAATGDRSALLIQPPYRIFNSM